MTKILPSKIIIGLSKTFEIEIRGSKSYGYLPYEITLTFQFDDFCVVFAGYNADLRKLAFMDWHSIIEEIDWIDITDLCNNLSLNHIFIAGGSRFYLAEVVFSKDKDNV